MNDGVNWYTILQQILTYGLTTFAVACATWAAKTSKRITILEEHDKVVSSLLDSQALQAKQVDAKLDEIVKIQTEQSTKLDLLLEGKLKTRRREAER